jgi:hypothetical protein
VTNPFVFLPPDPNHPTTVVPIGPLTNTVELIKAHLDTLHTACGFRYKVVFDPEGATAADPLLPLVHNQATFLGIIRCAFCSQS